MALNYARIHGPVLASLLESAAQGQGMYDGLLFGEVRQVTRQQTHDDAEAHTVEDAVADIRGAVSCTSTCSFYDAAGQVQEEQLQQLLRGVTDALLGWFVCRPVGQLAPSMREAAVTLSLQRWLQQRPAAQPAAAAAPRPPVLFAVLLSGQDHHGASTSLQYRLLQPAALEAGAGASPGGGGAGGAAAGSSSAAPPGHQAGPLVAVPLQTLNLGRSLGQHHAAPGGMTSAQHVDGSGLGAAMQQLPGPQAAGLEERLGAAAGAAGKQVADLAGACGALLARVSDLAGTLGPAEAEVAGLAAQRAQLLQQLHELRWQDAPGSTPSG